MLNVFQYRLGLLHREFVGNRPLGRSAGKSGLALQVQVIQLHNRAVHVKRQFAALGEEVGVILDGGLYPLHPAANRR